ncbi:Hypothetical protein GLP15_4533 [Giardia lamblia P15]|uniref:Flagellar C1a complex subunit C1a-32 n=1 Tax=Giardia intestinalis (strain P15) TaxID=658858 RepID=E1F3E1_GIAIA|nr:Hypothetical protein GLP15_4533 [Giardia lamblia P15]
MSNRSPLHITTHEYQEIAGDEKKLELFIYDFFRTASDDTQYAAVKELLLNTFDFSRTHLASCDAACALVTLLVDLHELNISKTFISYEDLREFAKKRLIGYSLECPPFYTAFFEMDVIKATAEFIDFSYTNNYKLWRYLFCPVPVLEIKAKKTLDLIEIQSLLQLGYSENEADSAATETTAEVSHAADSKTLSSVAKPRSSTGGDRQGAAISKKGQVVVEATPEPVLPKRILLPFNSIPLSLTEATLYQPPPSKTEDEVVAEEIRQQIQEAYTDEKDSANDNENKKQRENVDVDVERLAKVIETATNAQLEKARVRILAELESTTTTATSSKKDQKK